MEKTYMIKVIETCFVTVPILAEDEDEAIARAEEQYDNCDIVLGGDAIVEKINFEVIHCE